MNDTIAVRNPYTGERDYSFNEPAADEVAATCRRLRGNQPAWAAMPIARRIAALQEFGAAIGRHSEALIAALTTDTGRYPVSVVEVHGLQAFFDRAERDAPAVLASTEARPGQIPFIHGSANRIPYGLVGNISPWNFPVILSFLDTIPALVAGNAVVIKPSEVTPRWIEPMRQAIAECPAVAAVLDIVPGTGKTGALINASVDAVVFTGSVATGRKVGEVAAQHFIPAFLELGGKDPAVVLESADIDYAARTATFCSVQSTGQACQSLERIYVARSHYERFVELAIATADSLTLNYPDITTGVMGPFIFEQQSAIVMEQLADARGKGATIHTGGELINHGGLWMRPTVVTGVTHEMRLMQEETFGPVVPIMAFDTEDEAAALANDSQYGLSASVFAGTVEEGRKFARRLHAGAVSINDASLTAAINEFEHESFGHSGMGASRSGLSAYTRFTRQQSVMANTINQAVLMSQFGAKE
jgi:acyl-CoA reductase-like NAD-dependent aldehyde dehydrogenase